VPGTRTYSAHNRLHVNAPTRWRFAQSYLTHTAFGVRTGATRKRPPMIRMHNLAVVDGSAVLPGVGCLARFLAQGGGHKGIGVDS
jgi:hypothetical protein